MIQCYHNLTDNSIDIRIHSKNINVTVDEADVLLYDLAECVKRMKNSKLTKEQLEEHKVLLNMGKLVKKHYPNGFPE
jgi:hypothetical protein